MALIKGTQVRFTSGEAVIAGEQVSVPEPTVLVVGGAPSAAPAEAWDEPTEGDAPAAFGEEDEFGDLGDLFATDGAPAEPELYEAPLGAMDEVRNQRLHAANDAADMDAQEVGEALQGIGDQLMEQAVVDAEAALLAADPNADPEAITPYVRNKVMVDLDLEMVGTVNELRWTHLKQVEAQILEGVPEAASRLKRGFPAESIEAILLEREAILGQARLEAERLAMEAMTRSAETMAQAEAARVAMLGELEAQKASIMAELRQQAYDQGFEEGKAAGEAQAAVYVQEALTKLNEIAVALPSVVKQNEEKLVSLSLDIASKVIQQEIALQPEIVQRTVEMALKRVSDLEAVTVKVNPLDLDLILPKQEHFKMILPDVQAFSIEGNHTIQRGGCLIETNSGSINATIETQLSIVEELFRNVRAEYEDDGMG